MFLSKWLLVAVFMTFSSFTALAGDQRPLYNAILGCSYDIKASPNDPTELKAVVLRNDGDLSLPLLQGASWEAGSVYALIGKKTKSGKSMRALRLASEGLFDSPLDPQDPKNISTPKSAVFGARSDESAFFLANRGGADQYPIGLFVEVTAQGKEHFDLECTSTFETLKGWLVELNNYRP